MHTHATPVVNHEQTQHARCRVSDYARHVMHNVERRCGAYGLSFCVAKELGNGQAFDSVTAAATVKLELLTAGLRRQQLVDPKAWARRHDPNTSGKLRST